MTRYLENNSPAYQKLIAWQKADLLVREIYKITNEFRQFLKIAYSSLVEVEYLLLFAKDQKYLSEASYKEIENLRRDCGQVLWRLLKSQA